MIYTYNLKRMYRDAKTLASDFLWKNYNSKRAVKTALSAVISVYICYCINMESAFFAGITAIIMLQPNLGATIKKGLMRAVGTFVGFFLSIFIFGLFVQNHIGFSIAIFLIMMIVFYKKATAKYPYAWYIVGITFIVIIETALINSDSILIIEVAVQRAACVFIAIFVSLIIDIYLWPDYAFEVRDNKFKKAKHDLLLFYKEVFSSYLDITDNRIHIRYKYMQLSKSLKSIEGVVELSSIEAKTIKGIDADIKYQCKVIQRNSDKVYNFHLSLRKLKNVSFQKNFYKISNNLIAKISEFYYAVENRDYEQQEILNKSINRLFIQLDLQYKKNISKGKSKSYPVSDILLFNEFILILKQKHSLYKSYSKKKHETFQDTVDNETVNFKEKKFDFIQEKFLGIKILLHIPSLKYAIKGGLSVVLVIWAFDYSELPLDSFGGLEVAVAVITIVQPDMVSTNLKSLLRVIGCFIGLILGIVYLGLNIESTTLMFLCYFAVMFISGYVLTGGSNISYMGLQIAIAYMVATMNVTAIPMDQVQFVIYRFGGIAIAFFIVWIVNIMIWSESMPDILKKRISNIWETLSRTDIRDTKVLYGYPVNERLMALRLTIKTMHGTHDINRKQLVVIEEWIDLQEQLSVALNNLNNIDSETVLFIRKLDPEIFLNIEKIIKHISKECIDKSELNINDFGFTGIIGQVEELKLLLRKGSMKDEDILKEQSFLQAVLTLRRVVVKLKAITEQQIKIDLLTA